MRAGVGGLIVLQVTVAVQVLEATEVVVCLGRPSRPETSVLESLLGTVEPSVVTGTNTVQK